MRWRRATCAQRAQRGQDGARTLVAGRFGLPASTFTDAMHNGPHLLAPTGSDMKQHGAVGTIFAGRRRYNKRAAAEFYVAKAMPRL
jgi:hypothetical protein